MIRRRRQSGEGSLYRRSDGRWVASLAASPDTTGRRRRRTVYGRTRAEVARKLEELKAERLAGVLAYSEALTVAGFLTRWLEDSCRASVRPSRLGPGQSALQPAVPARGTLA